MAVRPGGVGRGGALSQACPGRWTLGAEPNPAAVFAAESTAPRLDETAGRRRFPAFDAATHLGARLCQTGVNCSNGSALAVRLLSFSRCGLGRATEESLVIAPGKRQVARAAEDRQPVGLSQFDRFGESERDLLPNGVEPRGCDPHGAVVASAESTVVAASHQDIMRRVHRLAGGGLAVELVH
jgi:hypothetical protein